ncbi:transposable element Tcb2 transposase [Trichonephila clavipes]|nr:transposable element Tcb2 transposase [Trichonephila clavipes]
MHPCLTRDSNPNRLAYKPRAIATKQGRRKFPECAFFTPPSSRKISGKNKTALEPKNVLPTLKHGGGNVMAWRCVAHNGAGSLAFIDSKMNDLAYIDVLQHKLLDSAKKLSMENTFIFQQDNDPKHITIVTKT